MNAITLGASAPLAFQNTTFEIVDRNGQPWLKATQIGIALGYRADKAIQRIYARHAKEFTTGMTGVVKLTTPSGEQETRIFSLRGAHLLGMFARTPIAAEFRRWVLDLLDDELARMRTLALEAKSLAPTAPPSPASRGRISIKQHLVISKLVAERYLPGGLRARFEAEVAGAYGVKRLDDLPDYRFVDALSMILLRPPRNMMRQPDGPPAVPVTTTRPGGAETVWLTHFDCHNVGRTEPVPSDSFVFRVSDLPDLIREPAGHVPRGMLPTIIEACVSRLK